MTLVHSPGPWERLEGVVEDGHPIYKPGTIVTRIVQKRAPGQTEFVKVALVDTGSANARLIAASPELLEAVADLLALIAKVAPAYAQSTVCANAEHAIAKASGESQ